VVAGTVWFFIETRIPKYGNFAQNIY